MIDRYVDPEDGPILERFNEAIAAGDHDPEKEHKIADEFIGNLLEASGFHRVATRYRELCDDRFWYA